MVRFQLAESRTADTDAESTYGQNVTATTIYLKQQKSDAAGRLCGTDRGLTSVQNLS